MTPSPSHRGGWIWMPLLLVGVLTLCAVLSFTVLAPGLLLPRPPLFNDQTRIFQIRELPPCDDPLAPANTPCRGESFIRDDPADHAAP